MKEKDFSERPGFQAWLRYWRNSLADAESGRGVLDEKELKALSPVETTTYQEGRLPLTDSLLT